MVDLSVRPSLCVLAAGLTVAVLVGSCSGGGVYTAGGWLFEGDDVIVVAPPSATPQAAFRHVQRTWAQSPFELAVRRPPHYLRTAVTPLSDSLGIQFNATITDSATVEVAGTVRALSAPQEAEGTRIEWRQSASRGDSPWSLLRDLAAATGTIQGYEEDPEIDAISCGGRRCPPEEACKEGVCRPPR